MTIADLVAGEGLALVQSVQAEPGLKNQTLDLDLRKANGQSFAVRMVHRVSSARDGAPGESRTIVLARSNDDESDQSASIAAMRFTRFFNNTPMAIASVDGDGRILRTNAPFLKLFSAVVSQDDMEHGALLEAFVHGTDQTRLRDALDAAKDRQGDIAPIDSASPDRRGAAFPLLRERGHRPERPGAGRGGDRLCGRDHRAESARNPDGADAEDECCRYPGGRYCA